MKKLAKADLPCQLLNLKPPQLYKLVNQGVIPAVRIGRQLRFDPDVLEEWIAAGGQALPGGWRKQEAKSN